MEIEYTVIFLGLGIIFLASVVQGTTGFGFALTSMPLLTVLLPLKTVVPMMVVFGLLANCLLLLKIWKSVNLRKIGLLIASSLAAAPFGAYLLLLVEERVLKFFVGFLIILFAVALWKGYTINIKNEKRASVPVGIASGLLNGSLSLMGPPIVLFLTNQGEEKTNFRANITAFALVLNIVTLLTFLFSGLVDRAVAVHTIGFIPAFFAGTWLGIRIAGKVDQDLFRKITLGLIIVSGFSAVATAV